MSILQDTVQTKSIVAPDEIKDFMFEDRQAHINDWEVIESGKEQGRKDLPPTDATMQDTYELTYLQDVNQLAIKARNRLDINLNNFRTMMGQISNTASLSSLTNALTSFTATLAAREVSVKTLLEDQVKEIRLVDDELIVFKRHNNLNNREAEYQKSWTMTIGLMLMALIAEALLNSTLLAAASSIGLIGGIGMALIISLINIGLGGLSGFFVWPYINHVSSKRSYFAIAFSIVLAFIAILFNLLVAHYREVLEIDPDNSAVLAISHFSDGIMNITNINSAFLGLVGIGIYILVALKIYKQNDRYPGFTNISKRAKEVKQIFENSKFNEEEDFNELFEDEIKNLDKHADAMKLNYKKYTQAKATFKLTIDQYNSYLNDLKSFGVIVVQTYREQNAQARNSEKPHYFDQPVNVNLHIEPVDLSCEDRSASLNEETQNAEKELPLIKEKFLDKKKSYSQQLYGINY